MKWFKIIIKKLLKKYKMKLINEPTNTKKLENNEDRFKLNLIKCADIERNNGNGYKIIPIMELKELL